MPATHNDRTRARAKFLFVYQRLDYPEVAEVTEASESTIRRWGKAEDWRGMRDTRSLSGPALAAELRGHIVLIKEEAEKESRPLNAKEIDSLAKLTKVVDSLSPGARFLSNVIEGVDLLAGYLSEHEPGLLNQLVPHLGEFTQVLSDRHFQL